MVEIDYPQPDFKIKKSGSKEFIFDAIRKKWLLLTPEEWVRQNLVQYFIKSLNYPPALIALEKEIKLGTLKKRFDILVYTPHHQPWLMVECKAMQVPLDEEVLRQILRYNMSVPVSFMAITNGNKCFVWENINGQLVERNEFPSIH
ncbi:MAG: type I restriction enzyme HsdR N-terminal domain-containing protein [Chitinophagaceae bacterium]|nr:type I restriction enzyme HsdR N-terminal domain-containing protein [Chitinophagaceae bacterium]HQV06376.1 type I restriction enzyme HsdR N-terminal domain-containing protein [Chitinophagaceae bacterium]